MTLREIFWNPKTKKLESKIIKIEDEDLNRLIDTYKKLKKQEKKEEK